MLPLVYHPNYSCPFPEDHRFVMSKFRRLFDYCQQWGLIDNNLHQPEAASLEQLSRVHDHDYLHALLHNRMEPRVWRRTGLPWSQGLIDRTVTAPNGTLLTARLALEHGMASHLAGGTHHAHWDFGSGFCLINDLAYSAQTLLDEGEVKRVLIFDLDVHQGDGTAALLAHEPRAFTCSIHCEKNFPFRKSASDLDIGLDKGLEDADYLHTVEHTLVPLLEELQPDLVLYDAGADVWQGDELGHLNISWQGVRQRDELVLKHCLQRHIPVATVIGGGYDRDHVRLAQRHATVIEVASALFPLYL
ncbi:histone deacetylase [Bacterioplanes sanyensis]|uniref:histone deacetylase family protein n=1 Tax=Bacterioplanes sanyensis TaxID=1249553 RepID=UPI001677BC70|nr:histone deacetylase [Bacterioplanes sanyensis]GGY56208.1 histone deacetylase [Bacterioplanes sanyensis]